MPVWITSTVNRVNVSSNLTLPTITAGTQIGKAAKIVCAPFAAFLEIKGENQKMVNAWRDYIYNKFDSYLPHNKGKRLMEATRGP